LKLWKEIKQLERRRVKVIESACLNLKKVRNHQTDDNVNNKMNIMV